MILLSNNHLYAYNHKSKYLIPLHPIVAHFVIEAKKNKEVNLIEINRDFAKEYSEEEINLFYRQYLFFKEYSFFEADINKSYGKIFHNVIRDSFNSVPHIV